MTKPTVLQGNEVSFDCCGNAIGGRCVHEVETASQEDAEEALAKVEVIDLARPTVRASAPAHQPRFP